MSEGFESVSFQDNQETAWSSPIICSLCAFCVSLPSYHTSHSHCAPKELIPTYLKFPPKGYEEAIASIIVMTLTLLLPLLQNGKELGLREEGGDVSKSVWLTCREAEGLGCRWSSTGYS